MVHNFDSAHLFTKPFKKANGESGNDMAENDPYQMMFVNHENTPGRKMTFMGGDTKSKDIVPERPVFETLDEVKKQNQKSALMRPTLDSQGSFVNRSICGSPRGLECTL